MVAKHYSALCHGNLIDEDAASGLKTGLSGNILLWRDILYFELSEHCICNIFSLQLGLRIDGRSCTKLDTRYQVSGIYPTLRSAQL